MQTSLMDLFLHSSLVGKAVFLLLLIASISCWALIYVKSRAIKKATLQNEKFLALFWNGANLEDVFSKAELFPQSNIAQIFRGGIKELKKLSHPELKLSSQEKLDNVYRALQRGSQFEIATLENHLSWLGTIASASPFVGLLGTVWGILDSFKTIGVSGSASLAVVGPAISEALIATAVGIAAAIPAVVAYNAISGRIKRIATEMECFTQDFLNIVQRNALGHGGDR